MSRLLLAGVLIALAVGGSARADGPPPALVGGDYYNTECTWLSQLIRDGPDPALVRDQVFAMRASGLNSLALQFQYTSDPSLMFSGHGGSVPIQSDGTLGEPYRSRFIAVLTDAKAAGFSNMTIRFYPYGPNSPFPWTQGVFSDLWNPSLYPADWRFVQDIHDLTKQYGPPQSHFDLMEEGPPNDFERHETGYRIDNFIKQLYSDYVDKYGSSDVFFTVVGEDPVPLINLIIDLEATGRPLPQWWGSDDAAQYNGAGAANNFAISEGVLNEFHVAGSLVVDEIGYESGEVAAAMQTFNATAVHKVVEVEEYPNLGLPNCVSAPFTGNAYLNALGIPHPGPLRAGVDAKGRPTLTTADGIPVVALKAGQYTITVTDNSRKAGIKLAGFLVSRHTSAAFRGTVSWTVDLEGANLTYKATGAPRTHPVTFTVLP